MKSLDIRVRNKYRLQQRLGRGGFGEVWSGEICPVVQETKINFAAIDLGTGAEVAIKLQPMNDRMPLLSHEADVYDALKTCPGVARVHWYGTDYAFYVLILDTLGPSLADLFSFCDRKFSLKTVLLLADQLLYRCEGLHSKHYIHRDLKPENLLMGAGKLGNVVHLIDFNLAIQYRDPDTKAHVGFHDGANLIGTSWYASINSHLGIRLSRRDDLESLGYILVYFASGGLPWQRIEAEANNEIDGLIKDMKMRTSIEDLCDELPAEFATYFEYVRSLSFAASPDYSYLRRIFRDLFFREGYKYDNVFDWTIKKFFLLQDNVGERDDGPK